MNTLHETWRLLEVTTGHQGRKATETHPAHRSEQVREWEKPSSPDYFRRPVTPRLTLALYHTHIR